MSSSRKKESREILGIHSEKSNAFNVRDVELFNNREAWIQGRDPIRQFFFGFFHFHYFVFSVHS